MPYRSVLTGWFLVCCASMRDCLHNTLRMPHRLQWSSSSRAAVQVPIPREQIHAIQEGLSVREAATEYEGQLLRLPHDVLPRNGEGAHAAPKQLHELAVLLQGLRGVRSGAAAAPWCAAVQR